MARFDNAYSRAVATLKLILPLVALAILSTLFLVSRNAPTGEPVVYSDAELGELAREQRLGSPVYSAVTEDGATIRLAAARLLPDPARPGVATGELLDARVEFPDGFSYHAMAAAGHLDDRAHRTDLSGGVRIVTSNGYELTMPGAWMRTDLSHLESTGPVEGTGPMGTLEAGEMILTSDPERQGQAVAVFQNRVRLVYRPQDPRPE